jgi:peptide chain release factor 1
MLEKLNGLKEKFDLLTEEIGKPEILGDQEKYTQILKERSTLEPIVMKYNEYSDTIAQIEDNKAMLEESGDDEFRQMIHEDIQSLNDLKEQQEQELRILLLPKDPNDEKNVIVKSEPGLAETKLRCSRGISLRMYTRYAERNRWKVEMLSVNEIGIGGYKEAIFLIAGKGAYSKLKYESGTHRVQRVPETESVWAHSHFGRDRGGAAGSGRRGSGNQSE